jgi:hypothetical protein
VPHYAVSSLFILSISSLFFIVLALALLMARALLAPALALLALPARMLILVLVVVVSGRRERLRRWVGRQLERQH